MYQEEALRPIRDILEKVRCQLEEAMARLKSYDELRTLRWRCTECGYIKHFMCPMPADVAPPCPKCAGKKFEALP